MELTSYGIILDDAFYSGCLMFFVIVIFLIKNDFLMKKYPKIIRFSVFIDQIFIFIFACVMLYDLSLDTSTCEFFHDCYGGEDDALLAESYTYEVKGSECPRHAGPLIDSFSDRHLKSGEGWAWPHFDKIKDLKGDEDIFPPYVEISFSNQCNMACAYCDVKSSSRWQSEILSQGHYPTSGLYNNTSWMERLPISYTKPNPYVDAFWEWWPELFSRLHTFRITGGEPLIQKDTFKVLDYIIENPTQNPEIEIGINSNLSVPNDKWEEFIDKVKYITDNNLVWNFNLFTSKRSALLPPNFCILLEAEELVIS